MNEAMHNTMCCPEGLTVDISWCSELRTYVVRSTWHRDGVFFEDEQFPVSSCGTTAAENIPVVVRVVVLGHMARLKASRAAAHSLRRGQR